MIAYQIGTGLYLNITNRCICSCEFCVRNLSPGVAGYDLRLEREPSSEEIIAAIGNPGDYTEIVFCGYGEPLLRLETVKAVAAQIKNRGGKVRINTNGLANLWYGRKILPELEGLVDSISISLNAENEEKYLVLCHPIFGSGSFTALLDFIKESKKYIPRVQVTVVDVSEVDLEACGDLAAKLGVGFRVRHYSPEKYK